MEKKKLLLVAISVGLFLVITIGAALLVFAPKNTAVPSGTISASAVPPSYQSPYQPAFGSAPNFDPAPGSQPSALDPVDLVRNPADVPGLRTLPEGTLPQERDFYFQGSPNSETVISVPKPSSAAVPDAAPAGRAVSPSAAPRPAPSAAPASPVASAPVSAPRPAVVSTAPARPAVQTKLHDDYWVQTGAFSTIAKAEGVKENLSSRGITSIIENRDLDGRTLFRVRVGPYTSQNEANYWLSLIKSIDGFEDSQIRMTQSRR